jgi:polyisoprenoid-binding protein YceI
MHAAISRENMALAKGLRRALIIACLLAFAVLGMGLQVKAHGLKRFYTNASVRGNQVSILSEATLEDFTSLVNRLSGELQLDPKNLGTLTSRLSFDLTDLETGLDVRDQALRGPDWFDTQRYPQAELIMTKVESVKQTGRNTAGLITSGTCTVHGVTRGVRIPISLAYLDASPQTAKAFKGDVVRIRGRLDLKLSDYGVTGPKGSTYFVGVRVADVQKIQFTVFASSEQPDGTAPANATTASRPAPGERLSPAPARRSALKKPPMPSHSP